MRARTPATVRSGPVRGIEQKRVVLGATYPGDNPAHVTDALRQLGDRGAYMNRDQDRYWLSLQQTVSRLVQDRADGYDAPGATPRSPHLREETDRGIFQRVHRVPRDGGSRRRAHHRPRHLRYRSAAQPEGRTRHAIEAARSSSTAADPARIHKNTLVFLAPDLDRVDTLTDRSSAAMAWAVRQATASNSTSTSTTSLSSTSAARPGHHGCHGHRPEAYKWMINPYQEPG